MLWLYVMMAPGQGTETRVPSLWRLSTVPVAAGCDVVDMTVTTLLSIHELAVTFPLCSVFDSPLLWLVIM